MVPVVSVVGKKNSGKTRLVVRLVREMKRRGYRVGTLKHDVHGFEMDHEGKDTYKHASAGADTVMICSPEKAAMIKRLEDELSVDEIVERYFGDVDIVITEGYRRGPKPKIEVTRSDRPEDLICAPEELIALAADAPLEIGVPRFHTDSIGDLVDLIERKVMRHHR